MPAMNALLNGQVLIDDESHMVTVRKTVRQAATELGFGLTDVTRIVTAASELARNAFRYAGSGVMRWQVLERDGRQGLELVFEDHGPGMANLEQAQQEGFTTSGGLGMGLPGAKRLMDDFELQSTVGQGTTVTVRKWRRK